MSTSPDLQRSPKLRIGKAMLALLYVNLFALALAGLAGIAFVDPPTAMDPENIFFWIFLGFIYFSPLTLLPFLAGIAMHAVIGGRLNRLWLGLLLAAIGASVGLAQAFGLMELISDQPLTRMLIFMGAALISPLMALWAGLYVFFLRSSVPPAT